MKRALFIGAACVDVVIYLDHLPKTKEDIHPSKQVMSLGGCSCNAVSAARLITENVEFAGAVGSGVFGEMTERFLKERGLKTNIRAEEENGCCYCFVEADGERTFLSVHGAEYTFKRQWMSEIDKKGFDYVYVSGLEVEEPTGDALIDYLYEFPERKIFYCPGPRGTGLNEKNKRILALSPVLHLNEDEAVAMAESLSGGKFNGHEEAAGYLYSLTNERVVVTLGDKGVYCFEGDGSYTIPAEKTTVVNTIGAGDTHVGSLIGCLTNGMDFKESLIKANKMSALTVASEGPIPPVGI
ncbi:carbohydrate kinase family protein [Butyrivibrio sp. VCD2006]|uniref:carbohydrate kinase family protein n=1 Tax=Butyrivibrio sp. VCD2006 TaxID=1280664 RepID=UPI000428CB78|nr:PfkB family carbohydrate kinase [Butyrivibrio sp. VCD2006]